MQEHFEKRYAFSPGETKLMVTEELRKNFLINKIFGADQINLTLTHYDRYIAGGAMPVNETLQLSNPDYLKASYFLERREMGIINVGANGTVKVDGKTYELQFKEALYIGRGSKEVSFSSADRNNPAKFYINSAPAHHAYPTKKVTEREAEVVEVGSLETSNHRVINKLLVNSVLPTCQLQMGMSALKSGSVSNTMPVHTHDRRMEVYFYFEVPEGQRVCHFL